MIDRFFSTQTCELWQGDCIEVMQKLDSKSIDLICADLPYGTTNNKWDSVIPFDQLWAQYKRILKDTGAVVLNAQGVFTAKLILSQPGMFKYKWVWQKSKATNFLNSKKQPLRKHEDVCVFYRRQPTYNPQMMQGKAYSKGIRKDALTGSYGYFEPVLVASDGERYPVDIISFSTAESEGKVYHPTQKPLALMEYLIKTYSNPGDVVLDNCMGSGTTGVAALNLGRKFIGIEKEEEYCEISKSRIELALRKGA